MNQKLKNTINDVTPFVIFLITFLLVIKFGSKESYVIIPLLGTICYLVGALIGYKRYGVFNWKDGLLWGVIGLAAGFFFTLTY